MIFQRMLNVSWEHSFKYGNFRVDQKQQSVRDFHQMIALQKLWKMFFIPSKKLSRDIQILVFPSFSLSSMTLELDPRYILNLWRHQLSKYELNTFCLISWERKKFETLSFDRILNEEPFYDKIMQKMCSKVSPIPPFCFGK